MGQLLAPVKDGQLVTPPTVTEPKSMKGSSELGKDAFLQLLLCQMQNQDPLNPSTDTEYVSQLATFSQLEELQNLSKVSESTQAFSLVGKNVLLYAENSNGKMEEIIGKVDFINITKKGAQLSVEGRTYEMSDLVQVLDDDYLYKINGPSIDKNYTLDYNSQDPKDFEIEVNFGKGEFKADELTLMMDGQILDSSFITCSGSKVTINKEAFAKLPNGEYKPSIVFNDERLSTVEGKLTVNVLNSTATEEPDDTPGEGDSDSDVPPPDEGSAGDTEK